MMNSDTILAIALGIGVPLIVIIIVGILICILRGRARNPIHQGYDKVNDMLDEEEIEFQRMIERKHGVSDEDFGLEMDGEDMDDIDAEDLEFRFSAKDKDRLSMLEKLRNNLVAGAGADIENHSVTIDATTSHSTVTKDEMML